MKISHHITLLILACMSMGICTSAIVYYNGYTKAQMQLKIQDLTLKHIESKNVETLMEQWLINLDLFLTNRQTYLYKGLVKQSETLSSFIKQINEGVLSPVSTKTHKVIAICDQLKLLTNITDNSRWEIAITKTDKITESIDVPISSLIRSFESELAVAQNELSQIQEQQKNTLLDLSLLLVTFTLFILHWSNKVIVIPLVKLTQLTQKGEIHSEDFNIKGSKEVTELSNQMGNYILALLKAQEVALAESEKRKFANARIRNIMETAGDAIICADADGNILEMNESFRRLTNLDINTKGAPKLSNFIPSFELNLVDDEFNCMLISFIEATLYTSENNIIPIEVSTSSFNCHGKRLFTIIIRDITDRAELTEKLLHAQKLESIGLLAAGIAHEINTPAQYIMDYNRFIKEGFESINDFMKAVHKINSPELENLAEETNLSFYEEEIPNAIKGSLYGLEQISKIVKSVKGFTHPEQNEKSLFSINSIIKDTVNVSRNEWKYEAEINLHLDENIPNIKCFPVRLNQVFLNLLVNSAQAIHEQHEGVENYEKGKIDIHTTCDQQNLIITVSDTGSGIPLEIQNKIFDPFFTTKEVGVGTGQGLALTYDFIVIKHNGTIDVNSDPGKGTQFIITLPIEEIFEQAS
jgi:PAS domain S-box-containing protein